MTDPARVDAMLAEMNANLDRLGNTLAAGHHAAPDLVMRAAQTMRWRLKRHAPRTVHTGWWPARLEVRCTACDVAWPCVEVAADFTVIGPDLKDDDDA
jgi:hypothetical protein